MTKLRATAESFLPRPPDSPRRLCGFFQFGTCRYGNNCQYLHTAPAAQPIEQFTAIEEEELATEILKLASEKNSANKGEDGSSFVRTMYGATVTFDTGAEVRSITIPKSCEYGKWLQRNAITCVWRKPLAAAFLTYSDPAAVHNAAEILLKTCTPSGRNIRCVAQDPSSTECPNHYTLQVRNLDPGCAESWFKDVLGTHHPLRIKIREPKNEVNLQESKDIVEGLLKSIGPIEHISFSNDPTRATLALTASFLDESDAAEAVRKLSASHENIGKIFVKPFVTIKFNIPAKIFATIRSEVEHLERKSRIEYGVELKLLATRDKPHQSIRIQKAAMDAPKLVAAVKIELERLLAGTVVMVDDAPLWHAFFGTSPALKYLTNISFANYLYVHRDVRKSRLIIYGGTATHQEKVTKLLFDKISDLKEPRQTWDLSPKDLDTAFKGGMARLQEFYGTKVTLNITKSPQIHIQIPKKDLHVAKSVFRGEGCTLEEKEPSTQILAVVPADIAVFQPNCPVCDGNEPEDTLKMSCGHVYHRECFELQVASVGEHELPLRCCHQENALDIRSRCSHIFSLQELRTFLSYTHFELLLHRAFKTYIRTHPDEYQWCHTPDCPSIYRVSSRNKPATAVSGNSNISTVYSCTACLTTICTTCKAIFHEGITCKEYQESEMLKGVMQENDIKKCPRCNTLIEKLSGCNHIECGACGAHICWSCLEMFDISEDCYAHMNALHGGHGGDILYDDDEVENQENENEEEHEGRQIIFAFDDPIHFEGPNVLQGL